MRRLIPREYAAAKGSYADDIMWEWRREHEPPPRTWPHRAASYLGAKAQALDDTIARSIELDDDE